MFGSESVWDVEEHEQQLIRIPNSRLLGLAARWVKTLCSWGFLLTFLWMQRTTRTTHSSTSLQVRAVVGLSCTSQKV